MEVIILEVNEIIYIAVIAICSIILGYFFKIVFKRSKKLHLKFLGSFLQTALIIIGLVIILNRIPAYQKFSDTVLMSSSLLIAVLGFAFQTPLSDIVAGIFISLFKPFEVDDRVTLKSQNITGIIESISIRHTVIRSFTNSRLIIPNHIANQEIIENNNIRDSRSANFLDVQIDYDSDINEAKEIIKKIIDEHPLTIKVDDNGEPNKTYVFTREFADNGIWLRANVWTKDVSSNFIACSEIRDEILKQFKENNIVIPYPHVEITKKR